MNCFQFFFVVGLGRRWRADGDLPWDLPSMACTTPGDACKSNDCERKTGKKVSRDIVHGNLGAL